MYAVTTNEYVPGSRKTGAERFEKSIGGSATPLFENSSLYASTGLSSHEGIIVRVLLIFTYKEPILAGAFSKLG